MKRKTTIILALALVLAGCDGGRPSFYSSDVQYLEPVHLDASIAYVSPSLGQVTLVGFGEDAQGPSVTRVPIGRDAQAAFASRDGSRLFVICHGAREGEVREADVQEESLHVIDAATGESTVYTLGNPFTALSESPSGRWVLVYFDTMIPGTNPNLISVIDMEAEPSETNPGSISIRTLGSIPLSIVVAEQMDVLQETGGADALLTKNLALVLSTSYITLFDLEHLSRPEITVPLTVPESGTQITAIEEDVIISNDPSGLNSRIIMRSDASSDIFSVTLLGIASSGPLHNDYRVSFNQLSVDVNPHDAPTDMALFDDGSSRKVLVTTRSSDTFAVVDPETTMVTTVQVDLPVERSIIFDGGRQAFLYSTGLTAGFYVDLTGVETERERNLDLFPYGGRLTSFMPVPRKDFVVMTVQEEPYKIFILDLVGRQMAMLNLFSSITGTQILMYPDGNRILLDPGDQEEVWFVRDMSNYEIDRILLDETVRDVALLDASGPSGKIVIDHQYDEGYLTFLDMDDPRRSEATSIRGFLLGRILDVKPSDHPEQGGSDE